MQVIINEFELVPEPQKADQPDESTNQAPKKAPPPLRPEDIVRIVQRQRERLERVRAD